MSNDWASTSFILEEEEELEPDWEEWDGSSPFWIHCVAGSFAGVMEHCATYPLDTVRTHIQVCAACVQQPNNSIASTSSSIKSPAANQSAALLRSALQNGAGKSSAAAANSTANLPLGMWQTIRYLVSESSVAVQAASDTTTTTVTQHQQIQEILRGWTRLWRGVQAILIGCIPAHALYFSLYEVVKHTCTDKETNHLSPIGSSLAGGVATLGHDCIMTPLDTIKQRMQLGHYTGVIQAIQAITANESYVALYRSFPVTLLTNIPYGMLMVTTHETCKRTWKADPDKPADFYTVLASSSMAGFVASAVTTPLDRIKTALQTQQMAPAKCKGTVQQFVECSTRATTGGGKAAAAATVCHRNIHQAALHIYAHEGYAGFFRGITPRVLSHTPAVAISWTTYETAKEYLTKMHT